VTELTAACGNAFTAARLAADSSPETAGALAHASQCLVAPHLLIAQFSFTSLDSLWSFNSFSSRIYYSYDLCKNVPRSGAFGQAKPRLEAEYGN
jgi:hypothetical protein